jgi:hypothetical protein
MPTPEDCPLVGVDVKVLRDALVSAADEVLDDKERMEKFWRGGYDSLVSHGRDGTAKWIGAKMMALIGAALLGAGMWLIGRFGR